MKTCKMKKLLALLLAAIMVLSMVACAATEKPAADATDDQTQGEQPTTAQDEQSNTEEPVEKEEKTIQMWLPGPGKQKDSDMVWEKFNEMLQDYVPNTKVEFTVIPFDAYQEKFNQMLASGEAVDLAWVASWVTGDIAQSVIDGNLMPLDDLIAQYGQGIVDMLGQDVVDMHRQQDGKLYHVPCWQGLVQGGTHRSFAVPTEFAELAGDTWVEDTREIVNTWWNVDSSPENYQKVFDQFDKYFGALKEAGKLYGAFKPTDLFCAGMNYSSVNPMTSQIGLIHNDNTFTVTDFISTDYYKVYAKNMAEYYKKGYIRSDIASVDLSTINVISDGSGEFTDNTVVVAAYQIFCDLTKEQTEKQVGVPLSWMDIQDTAYLGLGNATATAIPYCADEPERAMQVLNALYTVPELYQLLVYGIKDTHYVDNGDGTVTVTVSGTAGSSEAEYGLTKWTIGTCKNSLTTQDDVPGYYDACYEAEKSAKPFPFAQFKFDATNVADIVASLDAIDKEYSDMIDRGYTGDNWEETLNKWIAERKAAGVDTLIEEYQNQINAFVEEYNVTSW